MWHTILIVLLLVAIAVRVICFFLYKKFYNEIWYEDMDNGEKIKHDPPVYVSRHTVSHKWPVPIIRESKYQHIAKIIKQHNVLVWIFYILLLLLFTDLIILMT